MVFQNVRGSGNGAAFEVTEIACLRHLRVMVFFDFASVTAAAKTARKFGFADPSACGLRATLLQMHRLVIQSRFHCIESKSTSMSLFLQYKSTMTKKYPAYSHRF